MISEARLRTLAREQNSGVGLTEKDYVNSWILKAIFTSRLKDNLVFKGGTALSKIHFPERWRFSEDLDFTFRGSDFDEFNHLQDILRKGLGRVSEESGIEFDIRSFHENPEYAQVKVQYDAILQQKNTTSLDVFGGEEIYFTVQSIDHSFEDIPEFVIQIYSVEEIFVEKLRSLFQRARARDYFDLYQLITSKDFDEEKINKALLKKSKSRKVEIDMNKFFDQTEDIRAYWNRALDRLTPSKPEYGEVNSTIQNYLEQQLE